MCKYLKVNTIIHVKKDLTLIVKEGRCSKCIFFRTQIPHCTLQNNFKFVDLKLRFVTGVCKLSLGTYYARLKGGV